MSLKKLQHIKYPFVGIIAVIISTSICFGDETKEIVADSLAATKAQPTDLIAEKDSIINSLHAKIDSLSNRLNKAESKLSNIDNFISRIETSINNKAEEVEKQSLSETDTKAIAEVATEYEQSHSVVNLIDPELSDKLLYKALALRNLATTATIVQESIDMMTKPADKVAEQLQAEKLRAIDTKNFKAAHAQEINDIATALEFHINSHKNITAIIDYLKTTIAVLPDSQESESALKEINNLRTIAKGVDPQAEGYNKYYTLINEVFGQLTSALGDFKKNERMLSDETSFKKWLDSLLTKLQTP